MRTAILATLAALALVPAAANARTYTITITGTDNDQTNVVGEPFIPHYGYTGGPVQSWGFGKNTPAGTGWLDFYADGVTLLHEATDHGNDYFQTTTPFYSLGTSGSSLTFFAPVGAGAQTYDLVNGGTLSVTAVPEPAIWGMMIVGFGMVGFGMRNRKRAATAIAHA